MPFLASVTPQVATQKPVAPGQALSSGTPSVTLAIRIRRYCSTESLAMLSGQRHGQDLSTQGALRKLIWINQVK